MIRRFIGLLLMVALVFLRASSLPAQDRITPKASKGGEKQAEAWAEVPESSLLTAAWENRFVIAGPDDGKPGPPTQMGVFVKMHTI